MGGLGADCEESRSQSSRSSSRCSRSDEGDHHGSFPDLGDVDDKSSLSDGEVVSCPSSLRAAWEGALSAPPRSPTQTQHVSSNVHSERTSHSSAASHPKPMA
eukprot:5059852-Amphidinium_carterae.1